MRREAIGPPPPLFPLRGNVNGSAGIPCNTLVFLHLEESPKLFAKHPFWKVPLVPTRQSMDLVCAPGGIDLSVDQGNEFR